jgi:hypothetical protein
MIGFNLVISPVFVLKQDKQLQFLLKHPIPGLKYRPIRKKIMADGAKTANRRVRIRAFKNIHWVLSIIEHRSIILKIL